ncbi:MAG: extracellular solute-binding protein [Methanolobus sp.]|uniref:PstS family phosphate ABC transporter substrate-binding protein n=1 Tax=Methanolobus sp. TaxID=1874737 RepID=UPI0027311D85|nr:substrate-binding domain-containing protein [Methanolobus sp.]MDP2217811.1 extracellular solute-binding protein [Methanolobus sp.]
MNLKKLFNNEAGVSPIVATLVLVVVAIAGAAAVGTILGSFSSDVSSEASAGDAKMAASTELLIAGSSTVQPVSELIAKEFMKQNAGIKVTVQGGGSGAGMTSAGLGIVDIGAASEEVPVSVTTKYPDLQVHTIGGSAIAVIMNKNQPDTHLNISKTELQYIFNGTTTGPNFMINNTPAPAGLKVFQRADKSGTEDTFAGYLFGSSTAIDGIATIEGANGNAGVLAKVAATPTSIGFVDYGFATTTKDVKILNVEDKNNKGVDTVFTASSDNIKKELALDKATGSVYYPHGLTRPLNYLTNGNPNTIQSAFIDFAMSPGSIPAFKATGYFSISEI